MKNIRILRENQQGGRVTRSWIRAKDGGLLSTETRDEWREMVDMTMVTPVRLAITRAAGEIAVHNLREGRATETMKNLDRIPIYLAHSQAAGRMATMDIGGQVDLWNVRHWLNAPTVSNLLESRSNIHWSLAF